LTFNEFKNRTGYNKFHPSNPYTLKNIALWLKINNKRFKIYSKKYKKANIDLQWKCLKRDCGEIFEYSWNKISQKNIGCPYCSGHKVNIKNCLATKRPDLIEEWHSIKNGDLTPYDVTCGCIKIVWWQCKKGHEWQDSINNRTNIIHNRNCSYCIGKRPSKDYNLSIINPKLSEEWNYNKNRKKPEEYTPVSGQRVWWKCRECGHEWKAQISNRSNGNGCPECSESKGEKKISEYLNINKIYYIPQKEFEGLIGLGNGNLSYDFYLPDYNLLIEYQGGQHEKFIKWIHIIYENFEKQLEHDKRKKEYAINNNINLLEIWYWDFDNIEEILDKYLSNNLSLKGLKDG